MILPADHLHCWQEFVSPLVVSFALPFLLLMKLVHVMDIGYSVLNDTTVSLKGTILINNRFDEKIYRIFEN